MKTAPTTFIHRLYSCLLHLYPADFRHEFTTEMVSVFYEGLSQARQQGIYALAAFILKELVDLPACLLREYGWVLFRKEAHMSGAVNLQSNVGGMSAELGFSSPPVSWREAMLAALPCLALAFSGLTTLLSGLGLTSSESFFVRILLPLLAIVLILSGLGLLIFAWRRHWPRWSAGWYMFWLISALTPLSLLSNIWDLPNSFYVFVQPFLFIFILLGIAWFLYRIACQDAIRGVLAALPMMSLTWILHQEFVRDDLEGAIFLASWLLVGLGVMVILRLNSLKASVLLALGVNLLIGLAFAYEGIYFGGTLNFDAPGPNFIQVLRSFLPQWIAVSTLVIGPLLARHIREIGYRVQPQGLWMYRLALSGLLLILISNVTYAIIYMSDGLRIYLQNEELILNILAWIGLAVFLVGFVLLGRNAIHDKVSGTPWGLVLLGVFSLAVPFGLMNGFFSNLWMPTFSLLRDLRSPLRGFPESWAFVHQFPEFSVVFLGLLWVLAATWLAVFLNTSKQPASKSDRS